SHVCLKSSMDRNCPICCEYLFTSVKAVSILRCGHTMHEDCAKEMLQTSNSVMFSRCPICFKCTNENILNSMTPLMDSAIDAQPLPEEYKKTVSILCYECTKKSDVDFHFLA